MSKNIKPTSKYTVFVIYDDKSHYPSTYNVLRKKQSCEEKVYKRSDLSLHDHKFDLIYSQWNTREPSGICNVNFLMFSL